MKILDSAYFDTLLDAPVNLGRDYIEKDTSEPNHPMPTHDSNQWEQKVRSACNDVAQRTTQGVRNAAQTVLSLAPELAQDEESAIELIYAEYVALEVMGTAPDNEAFLNTYPQYRVRLERLLKLHELMDDESSDRPPNSTIQQSFDNYELLEEVGRGGMGVVYRALQKKLHRIVAIKVLQSEAPRESERIRFQREAESIACLHHPNIVQIFEVGNASGREFISMEFVDGGSLESLLPHSTWTNHEIAGMVQALSDAMSVAHAKGIVHRDLKPGNVLMTKEQVPKIVDFGLAKRFTEPSQNRTHSGALIGTPCYMSPEQVNGKSETVGTSADIYALGVILYQMLTKKLPFEGANTAETLHLILNRDPILPSKHVRSVPRDLETICMKCLAKLPAQRYQSTVELSEDLSRFLDHRPILARRAHWFERGLQLIRRHPQVSALAGAILFVTIGSGIVFAWQQSRLSELTTQTVKQEEAEARQRRRAVEAEAAYETSLKKARDLVGRWTQLGIKLDNEPGMDELRRKAFEDAVAYYEEFLQQNAEDPAIRIEASQASIRAGVLHSELGLWDQAEYDLRRSERWLSQLEQTRQVRLLRSESLIQLAHVLRRLERWTDSEQAYRQAIEITKGLLTNESSDPPFLVRMANAKINLCVVLKAKQQWDECLATNIDAVRLDLLASLLRVKSGLANEFSPDESASLDSLNRCISVSQNIRDPQVGLKAGELAALAKENYLNELALCLDDLGYILQRKAEASLAEKCVREAVAIRKFVSTLIRENRRMEQYVARSQMHLGVMLLDFNKPEEAESWLRESNDLYDQLVKDFPDRLNYRSEWSTCMAQISRCMLAEKRIDDAIEIGQKAVGLQEQFVASRPEIESTRQELINSLNQLARAHLQKNDRVSADKVYQRVLELSPQNGSALNNYAWFLIAEVKPGEADVAKAIELSSQAVSITPQSANYWNTHALAYFRASQPEEALQAIDHAMELSNGGSTLDWFIKSMTLAQLGRSEEAKSWYSKAESRRQFQSPANLELIRFSEDTKQLLLELGGF